MIKRAEVTPQGISLDGELLPLYSGAVHYWRLDRTLWKDILENVKKMGFHIIETYIPWSVHEISRGEFDFGRIDKRKDLDAFLTLCEELGLFVHVRPGPHINSEMTYFGYPKRIVYDTAIQARSPFRTPVNLPHSPKVIPVPSYASEAFYREVEVYFDALAPIIRKHAYPNGNIIALQSDNETCYFFRERPYVSDYHPDSVALYRTMLKDKYTSIETLNSVYRSSWKEFSEIEPPHGFSGSCREDLPYYLDWAEYKEFQICMCLRRFADMWRERGVCLPFYQNTGYHYYTPVDNIRIERECVDICGIDMYPNRTALKPIREKIRYMSGSSILPFVPEYGSGVWFEFPETFLPEEEEFTTYYAFMNGLKAINYYMLVERDRWQGSPITRDNRIRSGYFEFYRRFQNFLYENRYWEFFRKPKVLVLKNYDCARIKAVLSSMDFAPLDVNTFAPGFNLPPELFSIGNIFGFEHFDEDNSHWASEFWIENTIRELSLLQIDFNISDTHLPAPKMLSYDYIFVSSYDFMSEAAQDALASYAHAGKTLILGPGLPYLNMEMFPSNILEKAAGLDNVRLCTKVDAQLLNELDIPVPFKTRDEGIELSCHYRDETVFLWAANTLSRTQECTIEFSGKKTFKPKYNAGCKEGTDAISLCMPAYSISIWEVLP